jgi:hypothetical protein
MSIRNIIAGVQEAAFRTKKILTEEMANTEVYCP